jgi:hypothetical protein
MHPPGVIELNNRHAGGVGERHRVLADLREDDYAGS